jgi:phosphorylcholine metabolism protein LicD
MNEENAKRLLFELDDIMRSLEIPYFLYAGTCLGAVREKGFIKIDRDVDIAILEENFRPGEIIKSLFYNNFEYELIDHRHERKWNGKPYAIKCSKYDEHCDISSMMKKGKYRYSPSHISTPMFVHTAEFIEDTEPVVMYGRTFLVPKEYNRFLTEHYGDWRTPHTEFYQDYDVFPTAKYPKDDDDYWWSK